MEDKKIINVNMLGGFSLSQGKEPIPLEYANTTKMIQLLISVLAAGNAGIPRKQLIDRLYGNDVLEDPAVTLRVNAHRLRKYLKKQKLSRMQIVSGLSWAIISGIGMRCR